jgi:hypothetical protein
MFTSAVVSIVVRNTIFRKAPPSVVSGYDKRSINLNKVVDFINFHETIDFSLTSVTSSHVQIWKTVTKIVVGVKVL